MEPSGRSQSAPRVGAWARAGSLVGVVAVSDEDAVTLYDPGSRRMARVSPAEVTPVEAGAVTVSVHVDLPIPHGLAGDALARWVASLTDETIRDRARAALAEAGIDQGVTLPEVRLDVQAAATSGALCLCGARTPAPDGASLACDQCGREAVAPPARSDTGDVLGLGYS